MKIAIVIGHNKSSAGAVSKYLGASEYVYNSEVASYLSCVADIYKNVASTSYTKQVNLLSEKLNPKNYDLVIELHFNYFDDENNDIGTGTEAVIYPGNEVTRKFGEIFNKKISEKYEIPNRGIKERATGRGSYFLKKLKAPAIILEPFFGDEDEALKFKNEAEYAKVIKEVIEEFENSI